MDVEKVSHQEDGWEVDHPAYRVYFHDANGASDESRLTGADVQDVLAWADAHASGRTYIAYVEHRDRDGPGLIRLSGSDPNANE